MVLLWKEVSPVQVTTDLWTSPFALKSYLTSYCSSTTTTGAYSCLEVTFLFRRQATAHYLLTLYLPLALFVFLSWVSFWISPEREYFTSRTVFSLGALLGAVALVAHSNTQAAAPVFSYCRLVDAYTGVCLAFIFAALLQSAVVHFTLKQQQQRETNSLSAEVTEVNGESKQDSNRLVKLMRSGRLDRLARIAFPVAFLLFVIVYSCVVFSSN